jgi:hypothetical protein
MGICGRELVDDDFWASGSPVAMGGDVDRLADFGTMWAVRAATEHLCFVGGDANGGLLFFCETQLQM